MTDLHLRAASEPALAAALPMLRAAQPPGWSTCGLFHALDAGFAVVATPPLLGADGTVTPGTLDPGYHANLRLLDGHPQRAAILAAAAPFVVEPASPQRLFAGGVPTPAVPAAISDRQFAQVLALDGVISQDEALAWSARGDLPDAIEDALSHVPEAGGQRFGARMLLSAATSYERAHPLVPMLGALLTNPATGKPYDAAALDSIWIRGAGL